MLIVLLASVGVVVGQPCSGKQVLDSLVGSFGDGEGPYPTNTHCQWLIKAPVGYIITLYFDEFNTECGWDYVYVYDGSLFQSETSKSQIGAYSGNLQDRLPAPITSSSSEMLVHFTSDQALVFSGFTLSYISAPCPMNCSSRGECIDSTCSCASGFTGEGCQHDYCPSMCSGHGTCLDGQCSCEASHTGDRCDQPATVGQWLRVTQPPDVDSVQFQMLARAGHSAVTYNTRSSEYTTSTSVGTTSNVLVYGGLAYSRGYLNDVWLLDSESFMWRFVATFGSGPAGSAHHTAVIDTDSWTMIIFGGETAEKVFTDQLYSLSLTTWSWSVLTSSGVRPGPRGGHAAAFADGVMYVFGGYNYAADPHSGFHQDMFAYDTLSQVWTKLPSMGAPTARWGHSMVLHTVYGVHTLCVFGGASSFADGLNDLHAYHIASGLWYPVDTLGTAPPSVRSFHSYTVVDNRMFIHGGRTSAECYGAETWVFELSCKKWTQLDTSGSYTPGRYAASLSVVDSNGEEPVAILFGGFTSRMQHEAYLMTPPIFAECAAVCPGDGHCHRCTAHSSCGWCSSIAEGTCVPGMPAAPFVAAGCPSSKAYSFYVCNGWCQEFSTCSDCTSAGACGWCEGSGTCMPGGSAGPTEGECVEWRHGQCSVECSTAGSCDSCLDRDGCTWCPLGTECVAETSTCRFGPAYTSCPAKCEAQTDCSACTTRSPSTCMWCSATNTCFEANNYLMSYMWGTCWDWHYGPGDCPAVCSSFYSCKSCLADPRCGWCASSSECQPGSLDGPTSAICAEDAWDFADCPCEDGASSCGGCIGDDSPCLWCADTHTCVRSFMRNGTLAMLTTCPVVDVDTCPFCNYSTCGACTASPSCGWCGKTQQCMRGGEERPTRCPAGWDFSAAECTQCAERAGCSECMMPRDAGATDGSLPCGYCFLTKECHRGDASGPFAWLAGDCLWDYGVCSSHCELHPSCDACTSSPDDCGWCCGANGGGFCEEHTKCSTEHADDSTWHSECPTCELAHTCDNCTSDRCCEWCASERTCSLRANSLPGKERNISSCPADEAGWSSWYDVHDACPAACSTFESCQLCGEQRACGWCLALDGVAVDANLSGTCVPSVPVHGVGVPFNASCSLDTPPWYPNDCPPRCESFSTCSECSLMPNECGWCASPPVASAPGASSVLPGECLNIFNGPDYVPGACSSRDEAWVGANICPVDCSAFYRCESCLEAEGCVWLDNKNRSLPDYCVSRLFPRAPPYDGLNSSHVLHDRQCPVRCNFSSCGECHESSACIWCATTASCMESKTGALPPEVCASPDPTCAAYCAAIADCAPCVSHPECGFCGVTNVCVAAVDSVCPPWLWFEDVCPEYRCADITSCGDCVGHSECGWCHDSNTCSDSIGSCRMPSWSTTSCTQHCRKNERCDTCVEDVSCGWCAFHDVCMPATTTECPMLWNESACPARCFDSSGCSDCTRRKECGFCRSSGLCMEGASVGPASAAVNTSAVPLKLACAHRDWEYGSCEGHCASLYGCTQCTASRGCGWCAMQAQCHEGSASGPTWGQAVHCTDWTFAECPIIKPVPIGEVMVAKVEAGEYNFYVVAVPTGAETLNILVTTLDGGNPDVFVSSLTTTPTAYSFEYGGASPSSENVTLPVREDQAIIYFSIFGGSGRSTSFRAKATFYESVERSRWAGASFWIFYFLLLFLGSLLGIVIVIIIVKKLRRMRVEEEEAVLVQMDRVQPANVPVYHVSVPHTGGYLSSAESSQPYFLVQQSGSREASVFVVITMPYEESMKDFEHVVLGCFVDNDVAGRGFISLRPRPTDVRLSDAMSGVPRSADGGVPWPSLDVEFEERIPPPPPTVLVMSAQEEDMPGLSQHVSEGHRVEEEVEEGDAEVSWSSAPQDEEEVGAEVSWSGASQDEEEVGAEVSWSGAPQDKEEVGAEGNRAGAPEEEVGAVGNAVGNRAGAPQEEVGAEGNRAGAPQEEVGAEGNRAGAPEEEEVGAVGNRAGAPQEEVGADGNRAGAPQEEEVGAEGNRAGAPQDEEQEKGGRSQPGMAGPTRSGAEGNNRPHLQDEEHGGAELNNNRPGALQDSEHGRAEVDRSGALQDHDAAFMYVGAQGDKRGQPQTVEDEDEVEQAAEKRGVDIPWLLPSDEGRPSQ